jgi:hypothetical protein
MSPEDEARCQYDARSAKFVFEVDVPSVYWRFLIGRDRSKVQEMSRETGTGKECYY